MLRVDNLVKSWGCTRAVDKLSFEIGSGEIYALVGPNGSGKTTTIGMITGLVSPDAGSVHVDTGNAARPGFAAQELSLYRDLTPRENLQFFGRMHSLDRRQAAVRARELLELFKFNGQPEVPTCNLSGGWQRRLHVAIALVQRSSVVILDEPTAGLDIEARMELWAIIRSLRADGISFLISTHDLVEAERMCDRVGILQAGQLVAQGTMSELQQLVPAVRLAEVESTDLEAVRRRCSELGWRIRNYAGRMTAWLPERLELADVIQHLSGLPLSSVAMREVGLEHIWLEVTRYKDELNDNQNSFPRPSAAAL